jgi:RNA polymerase sigma factor (sigma-70 family)
MDNPAACGSVTHLIRELKAGNQSALSKLWDRYFPNITRRAQHYFGKNSRVVRDEEDIALSVMGMLHQKGNLRNVNDRDELVRLLYVMTHNKVASERRVQKSRSRGNGKVSLFSELDRTAQNYIANFASVQADPRVRSHLEDQFQALMDILPDERCREIVKLRLAGRSLDEIAKILKVVDRTVQRKMKLIQDLWSAAIEFELKNDKG